MREAERRCALFSCPLLLALPLVAPSGDIRASQLSPSSAGKFSVRLLVCGSAGVFDVFICHAARSSFSCLPSSQRLLKRSFPSRTPVRSKLFSPPFTLTFSGKLRPAFLSR